MQEPLIALIILLATILIFIRLPFFASLLSLPYRLLVLFLRFIGLAKDPYNWSVVYDSQTKTPIDPAYVTVRNMVGVEVATMITDLNGRFALILPRGLYVVDVQKTNYLFPSKLLNGAKTDGKYKDLYYGGTLEIKDSERAVSIAIPLDSTGADWNQTEKKKKNVFLNFNSEMYFRGAERLYLFIGAALTTWYYIASVNHFYVQVLEGYGITFLAILIWQLFQPGGHAHSTVFDKKTKQALGFARVTIFTAFHHRQIMRKVTSFEGQFVALVPPGKYYVVIERRDDQGKYTVVYTSSVFRVTNGYIGKHFTV